jgi:hypothetical protein
MQKRPPTSIILLVFGLLTSGSGCQILRIPSYRTDAQAPGSVPCVDYTSGETLADDGLAPLMANDCAPGLLPPRPAWMLAGLPVPGWWAEW